jgi:hypothetical protein
MPAWHDSVALPVIFQPITRKRAAAIWRKARRLDLRTNRKAKHGGIVGRSALTVLSVLIFDFLVYQTGRLDPSHAAIARKARMCERSVRTALARLKMLGILTWIRRATKEYGPWGVRHKQDSNAYAVIDGPILKEGEPPPPLPHEWGAVPPMPEPMEQAAQAIKQGDRKAMLASLEADPKDELAQLFASWYRAMDERDRAADLAGESSC